jgi:hypothetical protein
MENQQVSLAAELTTAHFIKARDLRLALWAESRNDAQAYS